MKRERGEGGSSRDLDNIRRLSGIERNIGDETEGRVNE